MKVRRDATRFAAARFFLCALLVDMRSSRAVRDDGARRATSRAGCEGCVGGKPYDGWDRSTVGVGATAMGVDGRGWMDVYMCDVLTVLLCVCVRRIAAQHCEPDDGCSEEDRDQR